MTNETTCQRENRPQNNDKNQQTQQKNQKNFKNSAAYRKKAPLSEKVLVERLSDMSFDENVLNPMIILSSFDAEDVSGSMETDECPKQRSKAALKPSLSLDVPNLDLENEAKRPPL